MAPTEDAEPSQEIRIKKLRHYRYGGFRVASEILMPEWTPFEDPSPAGEPEVVIAYERTPRGDMREVQNTRVITATEYWSFIPGVGCLLVRDGHRITVALARGATVNQLRPWLTGSAWAALCYQRGAFLIHASGVLVGDSAVLFCARTKGGKSTLAAQMNARGYGLVSDDLCNLDFPASGRPIVYPASRRIKLWSDALTEIGWNGERLEPDHARAGKFHAIRPGDGMAQPVPVKGVYLLTWGEFGIRPLSGLTALSHFLAAASYRRKLMQSTGHLPQHVNGSLAFLQSVPIWELSRPCDLSALGLTADLVAKHFLSYD